MKYIFSSILLLGISATTVVAQSNYKESSNSFARYMQSNDIKQLESAKKFIDAAYTTKRDSSSTRTNVLRAMVYSSLAYADSTRRIKTDKDPIVIAKNAVEKIRPKDLYNFSNEINYVNQNLTAAYIYKANTEIKAGKFSDAYQSYLEIDRLGTKTEDVTYNLALLASQSGRIDESIGFYNKIIQDETPTAEQYLELAALYSRKNDRQSYLSTLERARQQFPESKSVLFQLLEAYGQNKSYSAIIPIVDEAIKYEPENIELIYLAGYANENEGNIDRAKSYYLNVAKQDDNNYDANLALGLIYLNDFLKNNDNLEFQYNAQSYLLKANEIKPYAISALKGLALYYKTTGDESQLDRVNLLLNQLSNN